MGRNTKEYLLAILFLIVIFGFSFIIASLSEPTQSIVIRICGLAMIIIIIISAFIKGLKEAIEEDKKERRK